VPLTGVPREACVATDPELLYAHPALELALTVHSVASRSILVEMVASGLAVGILMAAQAETFQRTDIRVVPFEDREFAVTTYALCQSDSLSEPCARFVDRARSRGVSESFVP
jgi:DNA-binding transcriptional LysR family regulator